MTEALAGRFAELQSFHATGHTALYDLTFLRDRPIRPNFTKNILQARTEADIDSQLSSESSNMSFLVAGDTNAMSVYLLSEKLHFQDADKLKQFVKSKMGSLLGRSISSFFGYSSPQKPDGFKTGGLADSPELLIQLTEQKAVTLTSTVDFQDTKRRILRVSVDPCGNGLIAAADSLGRVTLFDSQSGYNCIIRLWKGLRHAHYRIKQ